MRARLPALYAVVDPQDTGRDAVALGAALLDGGARCLQLRLKGVPVRTVLETAAALRVLTRRAGALLVINDRADVAAAVGADGVHLGQEDLPVAAARRVVGAHALIGVSTHSEAEAVAAAADGADYLGVGAVYATRSKPGATAPQGLDLVRRVRAAVALPLVAIGGITAETAPAVLAAGADAVAMIAALTRTPDPTAATRAVLARLAGCG